MLLIPKYRLLPQIWMPPSPPNSDVGHPSDLYSPIDGSLLYLSLPMSDNQLPPLPPLLPSLDPFSRVIRSTRKVGPSRVGTPGTKHKHYRPRAASGTKEQRASREAGGEQPKAAAERTDLSPSGGMLSPPESAPNTPMVAPSASSGITTASNLLSPAGGAILFIASPSAIPPITQPPPADPFAASTAAGPSSGPKALSTLDGNDQLINYMSIMIPYPL